MRKVGVAGFVFAALLIGSGTRPEAVIAQNTKKPAAAAATGTVEIAQGKDEKFRFFVRDDEGKLVAMSSPGGFASADDAKTAIQHLKEIVRTAKVTMAKKKVKDEK